ncbi:MAG: efflux RND transporter periplasmic adaptor subunit [Pseudomonadota bacterium]
MDAQGRPAGVSTEILSVQRLSETVPVFGTVVASNDSAVATRVGGVVDEVEVLVGDRVGAGDLLARLNTELSSIEYRQGEAGLAEAEAGITIATARLDAAQQAFERIEGLRQTAAFSQGRFDDAEAALAEARAELTSAEARRLNAATVLEERRYVLDQAQIRAPFNGIVLSVEADLGQFLAGGAPVARLLDTASLEVEASVPAQFIRALRPGLETVAETEDGIALPMTVRAILPTEAAATRTRPVRFTAPFSDVDWPVAVGQSITVRIPVEAPRDVLAVPKDALVQGRGGWTVFVNAEGSAEPRPVAIGVAMGAYFEVIDGLAPGDEVVVRGNERLRPGQAIQPMPSGPVQN